MLQTLELDIDLWDNYEDTLLASHAISSGDKHGLKELAVNYLSYSDKDERLLHSKVVRACNRAAKLNWSLGYDSRGKRQTCWDYWVPGQIFDNDKSLETYGDNDVERTILLWLIYKDLLREEQVIDGYEREKELQKVVFKQESKGISLSLDKVDETIKFLKKESIPKKESAEGLIQKLFDRKISITSPVDLKWVLHDEKAFNLPIIKTTDKGNISLDKAAIDELYSTTKNEDAKEFLRNVLHYRATISGQTYMQSYKEKGTKVLPGFIKLYPSLNLSGTKTTRFSSSNPNGQNVGKKSKAKFADEEFAIPKLRDAFVPLPGTRWYALDYSQIEIRIFATLSKEQSILDALDAGYDFHGFVASRIFGKPQEEITDQERTIAKNTNFAIIFGAGPDRVNETAGIPNAYKLFAGQFPNVTEFMERTIRSVEKTGKIRTADGYRLDVPLYKAYRAVNYLVQGTAGRIIKNAMVEIDKQEWFDWYDISMLLQIHDELIFEVKIDSDKNSYIRNIKEIMEESGSNLGIKTPVTCELIEKDWGHGKEISV